MSTRTERLHEAFLADVKRGSQQSLVNFAATWKDPGPMDEPPRGSVVLIHGATGTAVQRFYSDGRWHPAGADYGLLWHQVVSENDQVDPILIYTPKED